MTHLDHWHPESPETFGEDALQLLGPVGRWWGGDRRKEGRGLMAFPGGEGR